MRTRRRARVGPDAAARFAAEYAGSNAAEDALWWLDHPREPGPSGASSPEQRAAPLRAAVYGRTQGSDSDRAALRDFEHAVAADRAEALAARDRVGPIAAPAADDAGRRRTRVAVAIAVAAVAAGCVAAVIVTRPSATVAHASPTVGPFVDTGRTNQPDARSGSTINDLPAAFASAAKTLEFTGDGVLQIKLPALKGVKRIGVAVTCAAPSSYTWLATGPSPTGFTGVQLAVSNVRPCTGAQSIVIRSVSGAVPANVQVSGPGFDAVVAEFR